MPADPEAMAHRLYDTLRRLVLGGFDRLLIEAPPGSVDAGADAGRWAAVADRLRRAAAGARPTG